MSLEDLATLVRLLKIEIQNDPTTHDYVKQTYSYFAEVYADSDPTNGKIKEF